MGTKLSATRILPFACRMAGLVGVMALCCAGILIVGTSRNSWVVISGLLMLFLAIALIICWPLLKGSAKPVYGLSFITGWLFLGIGLLVALTGIAYK